jgi:hypothetical protein
MIERGSYGGRVDETTERNGSDYELCPFCGRWFDRRDLERSWLGGAGRVGAVLAPGRTLRRTGFGDDSTLLLITMMSSPPYSAR